MGYVFDECRNELSSNAIRWRTNVEEEEVTSLHNQPYLMLDQSERPPTDSAVGCVRNINSLSGNGSFSNGTTC